MSKRVSEGKSESMRERLSLEEKESGRECVCVFTCKRNGTQQGSHTQLTHWLASIRVTSTSQTTLAVFNGRQLTNPSDNLNL